MTETKQAPASLGPAGKKLWKRVTSEGYTFRQDELDTLEDIALIEDTIAHLTERWEAAGKPTITKGSMGQEVIHPAIGELRQQRAAKNALWRQLKLPDSDSQRKSGTGSATTSESARAASMARWNRGA